MKKRYISRQCNAIQNNATCQMQCNSVHGKCDVIYCKVLQFNVKFNPIQTNKPTNAMQNDHPVGIGAKFSLGCLDIIRYQRNTIYYNAMQWCPLTRQCIASLCLPKGAARTDSLFLVHYLETDVKSLSKQYPHIHTCVLCIISVIIKIQC